MIDQQRLLDLRAKLRSEKWARILDLASLWVVVALALFHLVPYLGHLTDDSFLRLQFAKNLSAGRGYSFNAGQPTYGAESPLWILLIAGAGAVMPGSTDTPSTLTITPRLAWIAKGCGVVFMVFSIFALASLGKRLGWEPWVARIPSGLIAGHSWSARWAISGMETALAVLAVTLVLSALERTLIEGKRPFVAGCAMGLATLTRPECWLLVMAGLAAVALAGGPNRAKRVASCAAGLALLAGPWLVVAWFWFHRLLPNVAMAEAGIIADWARAGPVLQNWLRVILSAEAIPIVVCVGVLATAGPTILESMPRGRRLFWLAVAAWPILLALSVSAGRAPTASFNTLLGAPSVLLLGVASLRWATSRHRPRTRHAAFWAFTTLFAVTNIYMTARHGAPETRQRTEGLRSSLATLGVWAREHTPPGTLFALSGVGAFGYYSDRPVLDLSGQVTPEMAPIAARAGYDAEVWGLLFERLGRPAYLIDRYREANRLDRGDEPTRPYRFLMSVADPSGVGGQGPTVYSLYEIHWDLYDETHPRYALLTD